jgi:hypothetical protein
VDLRANAPIARSGDPNWKNRFELNSGFNLTLDADYSCVIHVDLLSYM